VDDNVDLKKKKNPLTLIHSDNNEDATPQTEENQIIETQEKLVLEENTKSQVIEDVEEKRDGNIEDGQELDSESWAIFKADGVEFQLNLKQRLERKENDAENDDERRHEDEDAEKFLIGESQHLSSSQFKVGDLCQFKAMSD